MSTIGNTTPGVDQTAIRDAVATAATRGWPVVPGTCTHGVAGRYVQQAFVDWAAGRPTR